MCKKKCHSWQNGKQADIGNIESLLPTAGYQEEEERGGGEEEGEERGRGSGRGGGGEGASPIYLIEGVGIQRHQHRPKDLLRVALHVWLHICQNGWGDKIPLLVPR